MEEIRLQKVLAQAGLASRRKSEELIRQGRVSVNGRVVSELGVLVNPDQDEIRLDNSPIAVSQKKMYILFYKPKFCVTSLQDPQGRQTVMDFMPDLGVRLFPVGRLDYDAEGLLIVTNDGPLSHRLQHPRHGVQKVYEVKLKGHPGDQALNQLRSGVKLEEGLTAPAEVSLIKLLPKASWVRIVLHQGWNRQIKRMCEVIGHPVLKIKRTGYGPLMLGRLSPGEFRPLTAREVRGLYQLVQLVKD